MAEQSRYSGISKDLETLIVSGEWPPGHPVPSELSLADHYGVARMTVNKALTKLATAGLVVRKRRSGTFVASPQSQQMVLRISDIRAEVEVTGEPYRYKLLSRGIRAATTEERRHLSLAPRSQLLELEAIHYAGCEAFTLERRLINLAVVRDAAHTDFAVESGGSWLLRRVPWTRAEHVIRAEKADRQTASRLRVSAGAALLVVQRRTWQPSGVVTWVQLSYPSHLHRLTAVFSPGTHQTTT
jgi:GntR family histidine utilization transcriptional repressor